MVNGMSARAAFAARRAIGAGADQRGQDEGPIGDPVQSRKLDRPGRDPQSAGADHRAALAGLMPGRVARGRAVGLGRGALRSFGGMGGIPVRASRKGVIGHDETLARGGGAFRGDAEAQLLHRCLDVIAGPLILVQREARPHRHQRGVDLTYLRPAFHRTSDLARAGSAVHARDRPLADRRIARRRLSIRPAKRDDCLHQFGNLTCLADIASRGIRC
jgi:hypothetical protein